MTKVSPLRALLARAVLARAVLARVVPARAVPARVVPARAVALFLFCVAAPAVHAQDTFPSLPDEPAAAIRTLIADAAARGLPTAPLVTKVREGMAKRATPERIRSATALLAERMTVAATALAPVRSADELTAAADALQAGVPTATLRELRGLWPETALTVPLGVLSEMLASGVSRPVATRRVRELLVRGATAAQFASLGTIVRNDIAAGLAPDAAMELRSKGVLSLLARPGGGGVGAAAAPLSPTVPPRPRR